MPSDRAVPTRKNEEPLTRATAGMGQLVSSDLEASGELSPKIPNSEMTKTKLGLFASIIPVAPAPCNRRKVPISTPCDASP
jgi:hypothetical protein